MLPAANLEGKVDLRHRGERANRAGRHQHRPRTASIAAPTADRASRRCIGSREPTSLARSVAVTDLVAPPRVSLTDRNPEFIVYAGVPRTGIYRSDDGGVTWNLSNTGLQLVDNIDQNGNGTRDEAGEDIAVSQRIELAIHDNPDEQHIRCLRRPDRQWESADRLSHEHPFPQSELVALAPPTSVERGTVTGLHNPTSPQGLTHFCLAADPNSSFTSSMWEATGSPSSAAGIRRD